ncbi:MAG: hypothetical protein ABIB71_03500 [Candidatus Woesearchaeota archaeon]
MRFFFLFLLLIPLAGAVTVAPAVLEAGKDSVIVINTLDEKASYAVDGGKPSSFDLEPRQKQIVITQHGKELKTLYIDEITQSNIVSSAAIGVEPEEKKGLLNLLNARTGLPLRGIIICALGGILIIIVVVLIRRFL